MVDAAGCEVETILRSAVFPVVMVLPSLEMDILYYSTPNSLVSSGSFRDRTASHHMFVQPALFKSLSRNPDDDGLATGKHSAASRQYLMVVKSTYLADMLLITFFTPRTSLANLPARSFAAALVALPAKVTTPFSVLHVVLRALVER